MHNLIKIVFLSFGLFFSITVLSIEYKTVTFVTEEWEEATNKDGTGVYWEVLKKVYEPEGFIVITETMPYIRAQKQVQKKQADGLVGAYEGEIDKVIFVKQAIDFDKVVALFKKGTIDTNNWNYKTAFKGKRLLWIIGYDYEKYLGMNKVGYNEVKSTKTGLKLLEKGRADYYLDSEVTIEDFFNDKKNKGFDKNQFGQKYIFKLDLTVAFADNAKGKKLSQIYLKRMKELIKSGALKPIFKKYDYGYPF